MDIQCACRCRDLLARRGQGSGVVAMQLVVGFLTNIWLIAACWWLREATAEAVDGCAGFAVTFAGAATFGGGAATGGVSGFAAVIVSAMTCPFGMSERGRHDLPVAQHKYTNGIRNHERLRCRPAVRQ